jgi:hypothetical protein
MTFCREEWSSVSVTPKGSCGRSGRPGASRRTDLDAPPVKGIRLDADVEQPITYRDDAANTWLGAQNSAANAATLVHEQ